MIATMSVIAVGLLLLGLPMWLVFLTASVVVLYFFTNTPMEVVASTLFGSLDSFVLLAVPGFIFAGELMAQGGMTERMIRWVRSIVGPVPGGMPVTAVAAGELFGAISGSSAASTAALGQMLYPGLIEEGYSERFSLGLLTSTGAIAIIIPPSITMILYSASANASLGDLFLAGVVPGLLVGILVAAYSIWLSKRQGIVSGRRWNKAEIIANSKAALWALGAPALIFGGIYGGIFTPTEAAAVVCVYALVVCRFVYRNLRWKTLVAVTHSAAQLTAKIFLITAASGLFSWVLTVGQVPQYLAGTIQGLALPGWAVLVAINVVLLIAGMFIDPTSAVLILTPILWPIAKSIGVNDVHFGIVMTVNMAIGMFSPPFGLNLFVASSIFNVPTSRIIRGLVPFLVIYLVGLAVITYVPSLSLWLPTLWLH